MPLIPPHFLRHQQGKAAGSMKGSLRKLWSGSNFFYVQWRLWPVWIGLVQLDAMWCVVLGMST